MSTIRKCDVCGKILEDKDDYFTLDEVTFHKGGGTGVSLHITDSDKESRKDYALDESWCSYSDKHFCCSCWKKESIARFFR